MPKQRKPARRLASTVRVVATADASCPKALQRMGSLLVVQGAPIDLGRHMVCDLPVVIGRDERVNFSLNDGSISRAHCCVERANNGSEYVVVDLDSTNGTRLNEKPINGRLPIGSGDKIFLGSSVLRFSYSDAVDIKYYSQVEEMVNTDSLTGLHTIRQYDAVFEVYSRRAENENTALTVLVMDVDGLKNINDTHGHEMGSFAIIEVAKLIRQVMVKEGHLARFGGDEFVACFLGLTHSEGINLAETLRRRIEFHRFQRSGITINPTLSIGVASYPEHATPTKLFKLADDALYLAKRRGKNRVESAGVL